MHKWIKPGGTLFVNSSIAKAPISRDDISHEAMNENPCDSIIEKLGGPFGRAIH